MPLTIDRVKTQMEVLPGESSTGQAGSSGQGAAQGGAAGDPGGEKFRELVLSTLRDHLRGLERRGIL